MVTSNICPILSLLRHINLQTLSDVDIDLSMSLEVKCDGMVGFTMCEFVLVFNM